MRRGNMSPLAKSDGGAGRTWLAERRMMELVSLLEVDSVREADFTIAARTRK